MSSGLAISDLTVRYGDTVAVDGLSLQLPARTVLAVLGPSGCGKSALLRAVAGFEPEATGRVAADGEDLARVPAHKRGFALMFQDGQLFEHLDVAGNVGYALRLRRVPRARVRGRVAELLDLVGLAGREDRLPGTLSGGERQRVALARALAVQPRLLLLDEPLSALDASLRGRLAEELGRILREAGTTTLMVTHDHEEAFTVADRLAVMRRGRLVQEGPIADVWARPADPDTALFLGYAQVLQGAAARRVLAAGGVAGDGRPDGEGPAEDGAGPRVAVRRSALVATPDGSLDGTVVSAQSTPEQVRLVVDVTGIGRVDAVAPLGGGPVVGGSVRLRVDPTRLARLR